MTGSLESYYQEAGRADRNGELAECNLLYSDQDVITGKCLIDHSEDNPDISEEDRTSVTRLDHERLKQMTFYSTFKRCLRRLMLGYFGERARKVR